VSSQVIPPVTHATPSVLRITRLPVGRRASGFVQVAKGRPIPERRGTIPIVSPATFATALLLSRITRTGRDNQMIVRQSRLRAEARVASNGLRDADGCYIRSAIKHPVPLDCFG
jgi:hypothetical protein